MDDNVMPRKILIADDSEHVRGSIAGMLSRMGMTDLMEAGSAEECVRSCRRWKPGIVLLDLDVPGPRGADQVMDASSSCEDSVIILMCSLGQEGRAAHFRRRGALDVMVKPVAEKDLKRVFQRNGLLSPPDQ